MLMWHRKIFAVQEPQERDFIPVITFKGWNFIWASERRYARDLFLLIAVRY